MIINKITIKDFRNIETLTLIPDKRINVLYGENANGKTNILEAIYMFSAGRSFRGNKDGELIKNDSTTQKGAFIEAEFSTSEDVYCGKINVNTGKSIYLNDIDLPKINNLADNFPAVIFSPDDMTIIKASPRERRRFIDNGLCELRSAYSELLKTYRQTLEQRNSVLKNIRINMDWKMNLDVWDIALSRLGAKIIFQRDRYVEKIMTYANEFFKGISNEEEELKLAMLKTVPCDANVTQTEKMMLELLLESREKDIACGFTTVGPHRDDLEIAINNMSAKIYASQGQQRSVIIALKLGEAYVIDEVYEETPVVLLDDVLSELDENRQRYILNNIELFQVFITCCDPQNVLRLKDGKAFQIKEGQII